MDSCDNGKMWCTKCFKLYIYIYLLIYYPPNDVSLFRTHYKGLFAFYPPNCHIDQWMVLKACSVAIHSPLPSFLVSIIMWTVKLIQTRYQTNQKYTFCLGYISANWLNRYEITLILNHRTGTSLILNNTFGGFNIGPSVGNIQLWDTAMSWEGPIRPFQGKVHSKV